MLKVEQFEFIRISYRVYGLSISEIARKTGHSRNTIRKVLRNEHSGYATKTSKLRAREQHGFSKSRDGCANLSAQPFEDRGGNRHPEHNRSKHQSLLTCVYLQSTSKHNTCQLNTALPYFPPQNIHWGTIR